MPDDPKDILAAAIATLPEEQQTTLTNLPPEEQSIAGGIALWLNGYSYRKAAALSGCGSVTLFRRVKALRNESQHEIQRSIDEIAPVYSQLALECARQQLEDVIDPDQKHSLGVKMAAGGVATDKLVKFAELASRRTDRPNQLADFFEQLAKRGVKRVSLDIETEDPAIDVRPKDDDS